MGNVLYVDHPDYWEWKMATQSRKAAGDPTWKERHAKGVPVKITSEEGHKKWYALDPERNWQEGDHVVRKDNPVVEIGWPVIATFCNFRYKPEWLEKRSVGNSDTPRDFDSPPIGGGGI